MGSFLKPNTAICCGLFALFLTGSPLQAAVIDTARSDALVKTYYPIYPETTPPKGVDEALVKKGEYLAKIGDCISCHTNVPDNMPAYAGGLSIATPFGTFFSPNITPSKEYGIGKWSEKDFIDAVKKGRSPDGSNYFPVFPYVYFANITDDDAKALYAYFMSIPPVEQKNKPLNFPFSVPGSRLSLWGWNLLFFYPNEHHDYDPTQSALWNQGKYIVDGLGHCSMCHTPLNVLGSPKNRFYLTGGFIEDYWAPNITRLGLQSASHEDVVNVFKNDQLINQAGPVSGPMAEVNHNSLHYLTESDHLAIATYLKTVESEEYLGVSPSEAKPSNSRGREVYYSACVICHQEGKMGAPLIGNSGGWYMRLKNTGLNGLYRNAIDGYNSMPYRGACVTCSDNDIISAVDYLLEKSLTRSQWIDMAREKNEIK